MSKVVLVVEKSTNAKIGKASATYAPIQSCPKTCPFLGSGCYAQSDFCGLHLRRLNISAKELKKERPIDIALEEMYGIQNLKGNKPLRLHVTGDARTPQAAEILAHAAEKYYEKHNQLVWTYTHAWRDVPREKWGNVSVLASCENEDQIQHATRRGYATCMVVSEEFRDSKKVNGFTYLACPQTYMTDFSCIDCKICFRDEVLYNKKKVVCFFPHGAKKSELISVLETKVHVPKN